MKTSTCNGLEDSARRRHPIKANRVPSFAGLTYARLSVEMEVFVAGGGVFLTPAGWSSRRVHDGAPSWRAGCLSAFVGREKAAATHAECRVRAPNYSGQQRAFAGMANKGGSETPSRDLQTLRRMRRAG